MPKLVVEEFEDFSKTWDQKCVLELLAAEHFVPGWGEHIVSRGIMSA